MGRVAISLLTREIAIISYFALISILVTAAALSSVVPHFLDISSDSSSSPSAYSFLVHRQNLPLLLPRINPFEKAQMAVTCMLGASGSLNTLWYSCLTSNTFATVPSSRIRISHRSVAAMMVLRLYQVWVVILRPLGSLRMSYNGLKVYYSTLNSLIELPPLTQIRWLLLLQIVRVSMSLSIIPLSAKALFLKVST